MINAFKESRRIAWFGGAGLGLIAGAGVWLMLKETGQTSFQRVLLAAVAAFVGINIAIYLARMVATRNYQSRLLLLYEDLDPEAFLKATEPLKNMPMNPSVRCTLLVHLANGWLYAGKADRALEILNDIKVPKKALASKGLILSNQATCWLAENKPEKAQQCMEELKRLVKDKTCSKEFSTKARHTLSYLQVCLDICRGKRVDVRILEQDFEKSRLPFHRLDVQYRIAMVARKNGDAVRFKKAQDYIREKGAKTAFPQLLAG